MLLIAAYGLLLVFTPISFLACFGFFIKSPENWRKVFPLYIITLFMVGYCIEAGRANDMTRYFLQIENLKGLSLSEAIQHMNDRLYVTDFFFWLSATLNMPHIMTGIPVMLVIGITTYIACEYAEESEKQKYLWIILLLFLLRSSLFSLANNIRNISAFAIAVLAVYREVKQKKRNIITLILYILPVYIHVNGILLIGARLLIPLIKKRQILAFILIFMLPAAIEFSYNNISRITISGSVGVIIRRLIYSAHNYLAGTSSYAQAQAVSINAQIKRIIGFSRLGFTTYIIYKGVNKNTSDFKLYTLILSCLALSCTAFNTPAYWRFSTALLIANISIYFDILSGDITIGNSRLLTRIGFLIYSTISIVLNIDSIIDDVNIHFFIQEILTSNIFTFIFRSIPFLFA